MEGARRLLTRGVLRVLRLAPFCLLFLVLGCGVSEKEENVPEPQYVSRERVLEYMKYLDEEYRKRQANPPVEPTSVSAERVQELKKSFPGLFWKCMIQPETIDDVEQNDGIRFANLYEFCSTFVERSTVFVEYVNMPRPQPENEILVQFGREAISSPNAKEKCGKLSQLCRVIQHGFVSTDGRIFEILKAFFEDPVISGDGFYNDDLAIQAIRGIGFVHVPAANDFLEKATDIQFWESLYANLDASRKPRKEIMHCFSNAALEAVLNLPVELSIPILEREYSKKTLSKNYAERCLRYLDEAWRRKKGEPRFENFSLRYDDLKGLDDVPHGYPDWLYGPGGVKIEYPFGKAPEGYVIPKLQISF